MPNNDSNSAVMVRELTTAELAARKETVGGSRKKPAGLEMVIETLKNEGYVSWELWPALVTRKAEFIPQILEMFASVEPTDTKRRLEIAGYLARLGAAIGHDFIITHLQNADPEVRWLALLQWHVEDTPPRNQPENDLLVALLQDGDSRIRGLAVEKCGLAKVADAIPVFEKLLQADDCSKRGRIAYWLLQSGHPEKHLSMVTQSLHKNSNHDDINWTLTALHDVIQAGSPAHAAQALTAIEDYFLSSNNKHKYDQRAARLLAEVGSARTLPAFQSILKNATDSGGLHDALNAVARLKPALALEQMVIHLDHYALSGSFFRAFQTSASEAEWDELVRLVLAALAAGRKNLNITNPEVDLLWDHGREAGRSLVLREIPRLWPTVRMHALWKINGWTIQDALQTLKQMELIQTVPEASLIEQVRRERTLPAPDSEMFHEVLRAAEILRQVPSEAAHLERPADHCDLLAAFVKITAGIFAPRLCRQTLIKRSVADPEFTAHLNVERAAESRELLPLEDEFYQVSFVMGHRLYEFETFVSERYYYVQPVETAVNAALAHTAQPKRLVPVPSEDGFNLYFFGEPFKVRRFCQSYAIPLSNDFAAT